MNIFKERHSIKQVYISHKDGVNIVLVSLAVVAVFGIYKTSNVYSLISMAANKYTDNTQAFPVQKPDISIKLLSNADSKKSSNGLLKYTNKANGYSFEYPDNWVLSGADLAGASLMISNYDLNFDSPGGLPRYKVEISVINPTVSQSLDDWLNQNDKGQSSEGDYAIDSSDKTTQQAFQAVHRSYRLGSNKWQSIFVDRGSNYIIISYGDESQFLPIAEKILSSLRIDAK